MRILLPLLALASLTAMSPTFAQNSEYGTNIKLAAPSAQTLPTVNVAKAVGWQDGALPIAASGFKVNAFADGLDHPRWVYVLPNGDVLVAESNKPQKENKQGVRGFVMGLVQKRAGAGTQSADRITLLRDQDKDGVADMRIPFLTDLHSPFGMALIGNDFYVANTDALVKFPYTDDQSRITDDGVKVADLPAGELNHHWTKNIIPSIDKKHMFVAVGSNSNIAENGMDKEVNRAAILKVDLQTGETRVFGSGLRNPVGMDIHPKTKDLWTVVNERDELGDDLVPDYLTAVDDGDFFGWPYSYFGKTLDVRVKPQQPEMVAKAVTPNYALGAHTASLGLAFYTGKAFPSKYMNGAFIGQHGSWNRSEHSGYKVIFIPFKDGQPAGMPEDFLTGFLNDKGEAMGRPVGVAVDKAGALLVADDVGNIIWRVTPMAPGERATDTPPTR